MKKLNTTFLIAVCLLQFSCKKFVEVPVPQDQITADQVFTSDSKATAAVSAIYAQMINGGAPAFAKQLLTLYPGFSSDELNHFSPTAEMSEFISSNIQVLNSNNKNLWSTLYQAIYYANACKEGLERSPDLTDSVKSNLIAEVTFLRGFCHFYLVNLYGEIPIVTSTDYRTNALITRSPVAVVYDQIISDLEIAENALGSTYPPGERIRPTRWAAKALLARVHLYNRDWDEAGAKATDIINTGLFTPLPAPNQVFLKNSKEAVWQLMPSSGIIPELREMRASGNNPKAILTPQLMTTFSTSDLRKRYWIDSVLNTGIYYFYPMKYRNTSATVTEYFMLLRCTEQYLIRAESRNETNNISGAIDDLNVVRSRAGLPNLSASLTKEEVTEAIELERRHEFFAELGHRWFDLKRTNRAPVILPPLKPGWQNTDALYPIPATELTTNPNMIQNPGY